MSEADQIEELRANIKALADISSGLVNSVKMLGEQNSAFSHAITILAGSVKSQGISVSDDLIEIGLKNLRDNYGINPPRDKFIREMLFGNPQSAPIIPEFTVIRGGKDDPAPDPIKG